MPGTIPGPENSADEQRQTTKRHNPYSKKGKRLSISGGNTCYG